MAVGKGLLQLDLYELLGVDEKAVDKEIKKAYRQKALTCHPDKNPDNPKAAELFHQLSLALAVLTDAAARAAYDKVRKAKKQAAERTQKLDERRKKVKLDLEARERQAQAEVNEKEIRITRTLEEEILWLREEGSRQLEKQQRLVQEQIQLISSKKTGSAVVEFATVKAAEMAVKNEVGLISNPLKISWLEGQPQNSTVFSDGSIQPRITKGSVVSEQDYESLVMMQMRQAIERQKLIEQLKQQDE
uniref:Uncharacterized protein n=1 Tax=Sphaerodactylus townsendi TaxID=933632 RepID=A0ACB8G1Q8_9SAUR